jgi:DNA-binding PucR family transcriptional regulator
LERIGLLGARLSIADAERTLAVTAPAATGRYSELWFLAALKRDGETVPAVLQSGVRVVHERPHLAAAVRALLDCGFSHQRAGRRLCVHPNTVAYRVERWRELTGWEIGRGEGLRLTIAALAWAEGDAANADPGGL